VVQQLEIFAVRACDLADRVAVGEIPFLDAIDISYDAALWADLPNAIEASGLIDTRVLTGDDIVQAVLAASFGTVKRPV
jgi:hypothetical protein